MIMTRSVDRCCPFDLKLAIEAEGSTGEKQNQEVVLASSNAGELMVSQRQSRRGVQWGRSDQETMKAAATLENWIHFLTRNGKR